MLSGNRLMARVGRSASWIVLGYGASQAIRLLSNIILTRLLFPEAFGLMALITVVTVGLMLFSDVGISPAIAQSQRGDDPDFLNTAWTVQVIRGFALWLVACALSYPVALFYEEPQLATYLPFAALSLVVTGFNPTRIETAHRHLLMGRLTILDVSSQVIGIAVMIYLAWLWESVAALVVGGVVGPLAKLALTHVFLPGESNRFRWEHPAVRELLTFGKWIFLSTICWFFASQGDKAILGKFLTLELLGIYNIGYFLASFPMLLGQQVSNRVMIPVYREEAEEARIKRLRYLMSLGLISLLALMALVGPWLVDFLYDPRYHDAGAILVLIALGLMPQVVGLTYDQAALAAADSRRFFFCTALRASLQIGLLLIGAMTAGLIGALIGMALAMTLSHLGAIWLARLHGVWDATHDLIFACAVALTAALLLWLHLDAIYAMAAGTS